MTISQNELLRFEPEQEINHPWTATGNIGEGLYTNVQALPKLYYNDILAKLSYVL